MESIKLVSGERKIPQNVQMIEYYSVEEAEYLGKKFAEFLWAEASSGFVDAMVNRLNELER